MAVCGGSFPQQPLELRYARGIGAKDDRFSPERVAVTRVNPLMRSLDSGCRWPVRAGKYTPFPGMVAGGDLPAGGSGPDSPGDQPPSPRRRQGDGVGDAGGVLLGSSDSLDYAGEGMVADPGRYAFHGRSSSWRIVTSGTVSS